MCESYARLAHARMLSHFGLRADELPLVRLDLYNRNVPFSEVSITSRGRVR